MKNTRPWWQLVIISVIFGDDNAKKSATTTVTVTQAARPAHAEPPAETLTDARVAADDDDYAKAVAIAVTLGSDAEVAIRQRIANRIARHALAAVQAGDRGRAKTLLARAQRFPTTTLTRRARSSYRAAKARAAERAAARRLVAEQRRQAAAQQRREQQADAQAPPEPSGGNCDPNYSGCVPPYPPDVNCPEVNGPVDVLGSDPHGLDRDNDGVACE
jgi:micrococcal nuclease